MPHRFVDFICYLLQTKQQLKALKAKQVCNTSQQQQRLCQMHNGFAANSVQSISST
jgi:hypothetical protein